MLTTESTVISGTLSLPPFTSLKFYNIESAPLQDLKKTIF